MATRTRLSQKQVSEDFYKECIEEKIPCLYKHGEKQGYFIVYPSYGGLQLQYILHCGGKTGITSGFVGAREMYHELNKYHLPTLYKNMLETEERICRHKPRK